MLPKFLALAFIVVLCLYAVFLYRQPLRVSSEESPERVQLSAAPQAESTLGFSPARLRLQDVSDHQLAIVITMGSFRFPPGIKCQHDQNESEDSETGDQSQCFLRHTYTQHKVFFETLSSLQFLYF